MLKRLVVKLVGAALLSLAIATTVLAQPSGAEPPPNVTRYLAFKPLNPVAYAQAKLQANVRAARAPHVVVPGLVTFGSPLVNSGFSGQDMLNPLTNLSPSDSTGAAGPTRYVELINQRIGVYDKSSHLLSSNTLNGLTGLSSLTDDLFDVQVLWDPMTNRFYYGMGDGRNNFTNNLIAWGFSKSAAPSAANGDWCHYQSDFGIYGTRAFPDFPKLGDSKYFILIGVNRFDNSLSSYLGSDVAWVAKPAMTGTIAACPPPGLSGVRMSLGNADGTLMSTPVPANEVDTSGTGWVVGTQDVSTSVAGTYLTVYRVGKSSTTGGATFSRHSLALPPAQYYAIPASAPEAGSSFTIDTLDARLTQAVAAVDSRFGRMAIWTQHTIAGGAGSQIAWLEIDTGNATTPMNIVQSGLVADPNLYVFNGAISPDRVFQVGAGGTVTRKYGSNMVLGFNTSGLTSDVAIQMVSKRGANAQSGFALVRQSPGKNEDFSCGGSGNAPCRWGDYAGASPDPAAPLMGTSGLVWLTNQWNLASTDPTNIDWTTWNWSAVP